MTDPDHATPQPTDKMKQTAIDRGADVCVIIVNYGAAELAIMAAESVLARDHGPLDIQIHIVDNASPGHDAALLSDFCSTLPTAGKVTLHLEAVNHGFGRGNNLVLRQLAQRISPPRYVFFINPDAKLKTDVIPQLAAFLDQRPKVAVVGCGIDDPDSGKPVTASFRFFGIVSEFSDGACFGPISRLTSYWAVSLAPALDAEEVDWVSGAAMMCRFKPLLDVGLFDPKFFLYFEETELIHRLREAGWTTWHEPSARVEHIAGVSTGIHGRDLRPAKRPEYWYDSWRHYFVATRGLWVARLCSLARLSGCGLHIVQARLRRRDVAYPYDFPSDFLNRVVKPLWLNRHENE